MCGIAGIHAYPYAANPLDRAALALISDSMGGRKWSGPCRSGHWCD